MSRQDWRRVSPQLDGSVVTAPARADVSVAMGITGTEIAGSAAKISSRSKFCAPSWVRLHKRRVVYGNPKKVIFHLSANSMAVVLVLMPARLGGCHLPLVAVQILWINIVTADALPVNLVMELPGVEEQRRVRKPSRCWQCARGSSG